MAVPTTGAIRSALRIASVKAWQLEFYAGAQAPLESRQVRRCAARKAEKAADALSRRSAVKARRQRTRPAG